MQPNTQQVKITKTAAKMQNDDMEFDLSDISAKPKIESREDIIAAAEAEAFSNNK